MNTLSLEGRRALVTGAARGIGLGIAAALAAAGARVAIQDIDEPHAATEAARLGGGGGVALGGDVTDVASADGMIAAAAGRLGGPVDVLVNNAAIQIEGPWQSADLPGMERQLRANLLFPFAAMRAALPGFRQAGYGRVINIGSIQQSAGSPHMLIYAASKSGLLNVSKTLARDWAAEGFTVNVIAPGYFDTHRNRQQRPDATDRADMARRIVPAGRIGVPEDCGGVCVMLASPAGAYITGQSIGVDGGMSAR